MKLFHRQHPTLLFTLPVILENLFNTGTGLIFSWLIGGISASSLTTISQCNQIIIFINALATMLVTGSGILCARLLGAHEPDEASRVVEQTLQLAIVGGVVIAALCLCFAGPLMALVMPNAEAAVLAEGVAFFRVLILSLPFMLMMNVIGSVLRSSGDSRSPMVVTLTASVLQLLFAWLFMRAMDLGISGAGMTYLFARLGAAALGVIMLLNSHRCRIRLRGLLKFHAAITRRILAVGVPTSVESIFCQAGYLIANSMVIGLGTFQAAAYNVANTIYSFCSLPQAICAPIAMTMVGQLIGARDLKRARRTGWRIWAAGMLVSFVINLAVALIGLKLTPIYSSDPAVQQLAAHALWFTLVMSIPGISLNSMDPQLRVGGDVKYVMYTTIIGVWAIRLPLTWLMCYVWKLGAPGVFLANAISLYVRAILNTLRFLKGKYLSMRV